MAKSIAAQVFISEQAVYTPADLKVHARSGDLTGPLAEAGFKGHPSCGFCRKPFYGDNELFNHMQQSHEQCFLCRRARPDKYVYYRDYAELEGHFPVCFRQENYYLFSYIFPICSKFWVSGLCRAACLPCHWAVRWALLEAQACLLISDGFGSPVALHWQSPVSLRTRVPACMCGGAAGRCC